MKLYRQKPTYVTAMPVTGPNGAALYAVQECDALGKPSGTEMQLVEANVFEKTYEAYRVRPDRIPAAKGGTKRVRNRKPAATKPAEGAPADGGVRIGDVGDTVPDDVPSGALV